MNAPERHILPAAAYRSLTPFYDPVVRSLLRERTWKEALIGGANIEGACRLLDLGCGTGTLALRLAELHPACSVVGLDGDPQILEIARTKADRTKLPVSFVEGLSTALPLPDQSCDHVFCTLMLHHLLAADKTRTAAEAHRVLRPGGWLHVADWGKPQNLLMRGLFFFLQLLDGFATTRDHVHGRLPELLAAGGPWDIHEGPAFATMLGTLRVMRLRKPERQTEA